MSSFFADEDSDNEDLPDLPPPLPPNRWTTNARASTSSIAGSSRGDETRIPSSTVSPSRASSVGIGSLLDDSDGRRRGGIEQGVEQMEIDDLDDEELDDVRRMGKVWVKERGTVELMVWEGDLVDSLFDKLEQQQKMLTTLRSDPATSEEEHFKLMLVQTEMERVKYLVRSYVRTRLSKIEKFSQYIVLNPRLHQLLSGAELNHAKRYTELLHTHFQHSVLDSLPEWLQKMDDSYGDGLSMVVKPDRNVPVLIYCRKDCGEIVLEGGERAALAKGTTHLVKYKLVDRWIKLEWAEVL